MWKILKQLLYYNLLDVLFPSKSSVQWQEVTTKELLRLVQVKRVLDIPEAYALLPYQNERVRELIHAMKYRGQKQLTKKFGAVLTSGISRLKLHPETIVVPIPLSKNRLHERGFNQTDCIAKACGTYQVSSVLTRTKNNEHQARLSKAQRIENTQGVFEVSVPTVVAGKHIVLLDDVITTGSTIREARKVLLDAGAQKVTCVAIAH